MKKNIILCYHNGALGYSTHALFECCSTEGSSKIPVFNKGLDLHHFVAKNNIVKVKHPHCDIDAEQKKGNIVLSSTSLSEFGRYLALLMGLKKWNKKIPQMDNPSVYKQYGQGFGSQLEILSLTLNDKVNKEQDWFTNADYNFEILDYWQNTDNITNTMKQCGLTPMDNEVKKFSNCVAETNIDYYNEISQCFHIVNLILNGIAKTIDLNFYQCAVVHGQLLKRLGAGHTTVKLFLEKPTSTNNFIQAFKL